MQQVTLAERPPHPSAADSSSKPLGLGRRPHLLAIAAVAAVPILLFAAALAYDSVTTERAALEEGLWRASRDALGAVDKTLGSHAAALEIAATFLEPDHGPTAAFLEGPAARLRERYGWTSISLAEAQPTGSGSWVAAVLPREIAGSLPATLVQVPLRENGLALTAILDSRVFSEILSRSAVPPVWTVAAIDRNFRIVGRNRAPEAFVGTSITPSLRAQIEQANEGFFFASNKEGDRVYTLFTRSAVSGWTIAIGAPAEVVERPLLWSKLSVLGAGGSAVAIAGLLALFLVRNFERGQEAEARVAALTAEAETERRLSEIAKNFPGAIYRRVLHPDGTVSFPFLSEGVERLFGLPSEILRQRRPIGDLPEILRYEQDVGLVEALQHSARELTPFRTEAPIRLPNGETRWLRSMAQPHRLEDGAVAWDGVALDVTEEKQADENKRVLMAELDHRVRNSLAVVQSLASATLPRDTAREAYFGRLKALAHAHQLLAETRWTGGSLQRIAELELAPYRSRAGAGCVTIEGEPVMLRPEAAQAFVLVLHELVTNAAKYGALSAPAGQVTLRWVVTGKDDTSRLVVTWVETGGPPATPPTRQGFGQQLIQHSIRHSLDGETVLDFRSEGLRCEIRVPLRKATFAG